MNDVNSELSNVSPEFQTHYRGQGTSLLFQAGIDPGPTDFLS